MIKIVTIFLLLSRACLFWSQPKDDLNVLVYTGMYEGYKIFIENPFDAEGVGFSVKHVEVNGLELTQQVFSSAFEIDLAKLNVSVGDSISIHLFYNSKVVPKIINTGSMYKTSTAFNKQLTDCKLNYDTLLTWCYFQKGLPSDFIIEQERWNRWIKLGEVRCINAQEKNCYEFVIPEIVAGEGQFRIVQFTSDEKKLEGKAIKVKNHFAPVEVIGDCSGGSYLFSRPTMYEVYNAQGNLIRKGYSDCPKTCGLQKGMYYINYGNVSGEVFNIKHESECNNDLIAE